MNPTDSIFAILAAAPERDFVAIDLALATAPAANATRFANALVEALHRAAASGMAFGPPNYYSKEAEVRKFLRRKPSPRPTCKREVDALIAPYGLEVIHQRGSGYFYFLDKSTGEQAGESLYVCYYTQMTAGQWAEEAAARKLALDAERRENGGRQC